MGWDHCSSCAGRTRLSKLAGRKLADLEWWFVSVEGWVPRARWECCHLQTRPALFLFVELMRTPEEGIFFIGPSSLEGGPPTELSLATDILLPLCHISLCLDQRPCFVSFCLTAVFHCVEEMNSRISVALIPMS